MKPAELALIIPVYNEHEVISRVIADWDHMLKTLGIAYEIHVYNDGSKDNTGDVIDGLIEKYPALRVHHKLNSGHGPTILKGYLDNVDTPWLFQVDSDNEISAEYFPTFWTSRQDHDFIIGVRQHADRPAIRKVISAVSRSVIMLFYGKALKDVNTPFRLMRSEKFRDIFNSIPQDTFAPNVIISGAAALKRMRILELPVQSVMRQSGEVSIKKWKLFKATAKSFSQTIRYRMIHG